MATFIETERSDPCAGLRKNVTKRKQTVCYLSQSKSYSSISFTHLLAPVKIVIKSKMHQKVDNLKKSESRERANHYRFRVNIEHL